MTARDTVSDVWRHELCGPHCYICGEQLRPAPSAAAASELCTECRATAADALSRGDEVVVNHWAALLDDPMRPALTTDGWEGLIIDSLVDAGLAITYELETTMLGHCTPTAGFVDSFCREFEEVET